LISAISPLKLNSQKLNSVKKSNSVSFTSKDTIGRKILDNVDPFGTSIIGVTRITVAHLKGDSDEVKRLATLEKKKLKRTIKIAARIFGADLFD